MKHLQITTQGGEGGRGRERSREVRKYTWVNNWFITEKIICQDLWTTWDITSWVISSIMRCCGHNGLPKVSESLPLESLSSRLCRYNDEDGVSIFLCHLSGANVTPRIFLKERGSQERQAKVWRRDSGGRGPIKRDVRRWMALREEDGAMGLRMHVTCRSWKKQEM